VSLGFEFLPPSPRLAGLVRQHQVIRLRFDPAEPVPPKPYWPRPAAALAFYLRAPETVRSPLWDGARAKPRAALIGQPTSLTWRQGGHDFSVYQIELEPGALHRLTGLSLADLTDEAIDAEAVFPPDFRGLVDRLAETEAPKAMIALAEDYLLRALERANRGRGVADLIAQQLIATPGASVERLARRCDLSPRTLRRDFIARMGISPKLFARIARFDLLLRLRNRAPETDWLTVAVHAGYYDDHHVRRDFKAFAQTTPTEYWTAESLAPERRFGFRET
jgi:AraC-like DNA-binding protein